MLLMYDHIMDNVSMWIINLLPHTSCLLRVVSILRGEVVEQTREKVYIYLLKISNAAYIGKVFALEKAA